MVQQEVRVPLGTRVIFTREHEEPHPRFPDVNRVIQEDVVAVSLTDRITRYSGSEGRGVRHDGVILTTRSAETIHLTSQEWVHPEDGERV
jgi:hypothetical protein